MIQLLAMYFQPNAFCQNGKIYEQQDEKTCSCGLKLVDVGIKVRGTSICYCGAILGKEMIWTDRKLFVEIGSEDEHSTYENVEQLCDSKR